MNRQPYRSPPQWWPPKLDPRWVSFCHASRRRTLRKQQKIVQIDLQGLEHLRGALASGAGVMITPNHAFHYDSYVLFEASEKLNLPFHTLTAWQVFAMSTRFEQWSMQKHGCFSIDRESADLRAFKQAVEIIQQSQYPLVVFPEGDIYHTNDRVTPFREGAAAMALAAARRADRPTVCVPCAIKTWYVTDPTPNLLKMMDLLERKINWRPRPRLPLIDRIYQFSEGLLTLKELEYLGTLQTGPVGMRTAALADRVLTNLEKLHPAANRPTTTPERVKDLRRIIIEKAEAANLTVAMKQDLGEQMEDLFFVMQLYSYPGDYVAENPTWERLAETLDKFEEDVLGADYPTIRGERRVVVQFGEPVPVPKEKGSRGATGELTLTLQGRVQGLLNGLLGTS